MMIRGNFCGMPWNDGMVTVAELVGLEVLGSYSLSAINKIIIACKLCVSVPYDSHP